MDIYLVGGAVRDKLLGLEPKDKDWVVVGSCEKDMLKQGFIKVGKDFPVYIHPFSKEEYALARTERKTHSGYYGFETDTSVNITLEQDLARRDLTINSIAMDNNGNIIDPFDGKIDISNKILRHTTEAFAEDPLRVIRLARFMAQLSNYDFRIHSHTEKLVASIFKSGELSHLAPERLNIELSKSLANSNIFFNTLARLKCLSVVFPSITIDKLPQENIYKSIYFEKLSNEIKIALVLAGHNIKNIDNLKTEICLSNQIIKQSKVFSLLQKSCNDNIISKEELLENIKLSNLLRDEVLFKNTASSSDILCEAYNLDQYRLSNILNIIISLKNIDYKKIIKNHKTKIPLVIKNAQLDIIKKQLEI